MLSAVHRAEQQRKDQEKEERAASPPQPQSSRPSQFVDVKTVLPDADDDLILVRESLKAQVVTGVAFGEERAWGVFSEVVNLAGLNGADRSIGRLSRI